MFLPLEEIEEWTNELEHGDGKDESDYRDGFSEKFEDKLESLIKLDMKALMVLKTKKTKEGILYLELTNTVFLP